ncbi:catecholate siderophore receptor Fiu [Xylophilus sp.]|uniref:catecholate siderophore receptor Fiu n=1 Tax=Xylophilus sp. TaxID=2653893 RepID=UPI0013BCFD31|nr:catecholate siderophore receptor Fiu [Xylophilus sp.]KAF1047955.1 MAG: Catecholate siderophore receptor Fiu [Xylophilus sp.]
MTQKNTYIKSRRHGAPRTAGAAAAALMALAAPAQAQPSSGGTLGEVKVQATQDLYRAETVSSPKFTQPLVDTPQTVSVIKEQVLREQTATTLTEALRNTPGASTFFLGENGSTSTGDAIYMRGFDSSSSIFVDGVRDIGAISRDVFNIQQVEVVKGPAGTDNGRTAPSGAINLVSKQPTLDDSFSASLGAGSASYKRATADWNKTLSGYPGAALRLNVVDDDSGVAGRDVVRNRRRGIAPSIAFGLDTPTRVIVNLLHIEQDNIPDGGVPTIGLPGYTTPDALAYGARRTFLNSAARVDSRNFYGTTSDFAKVQADQATLRIEHDFSPDLKLRNTTRVGRIHNDYSLTSFMLGGYPAPTAAALTAASAFLATPNPSDPSTWTVTRNLPTNVNQVNRIVVNQTNVTAALATGGIQHDLSTGLELSREEQTNLGYYGQGFAGISTTYAPAGAWPAANLYNPNPNVSGFRRIANGTWSKGQTDTVAAYAFDTLKFSPQWQLTGGVRVDHYKTDFDAVTQAALPAGTLTPSSLSVSDTLVSGKLGLVFKPAHNGSVYALAATSAQPPGGANNQLSAAANSAANPKFDPQKARTYEVGTKWDVLDKRLALTAAAYRTTVSNDIEVDPTNASNYLQTGRKRVQGLEFAAVGALTHDWTISTGYTVMDTKILSGTVKNADGTDGLSYTPKSAFTLWTTYRLPFGVTVGGGARFAGKLRRGTDGAVGTPAYTDAYWVFDAMTSYHVNKNLDLQLNVFNLADKDYVAAINKSGYRYTPGIARSARLTANLTF